MSTQEVKNALARMKKVRALGSRYGLVDEIVQQNFKY